LCDTTAGDQGDGGVLQNVAGANELHMVRLASRAGLESCRPFQRLIEEKDKESLTGGEKIAIFIQFRVSPVRAAVDVRNSGLEGRLKPGEVTPHPQKWADRVNLRYTGYKKR
jgi:hypothetical protein